MGASAAIGIHNDFPAGEPRVSMWTTNNKFTGGIYMQDEMIIKEILQAIDQAANVFGKNAQEKYERKGEW